MLFDWPRKAGDRWVDILPKSLDTWANDLPAAGARLIATQLYGLNDTGSRWSLARYQHVESATQLYGVNVIDPVTIGVAVGILGAVALIAAYIPAMRAARVDPMRALHE